MKPTLTADHVACAIIAAARRTGEDPEDCVAGRGAMACRRYALETLRALFPAASLTVLSRHVGVPDGQRNKYAHRPKPKTYNAENLRIIIAECRRLIEARAISGTVAAQPPVSHDRDAMQSTIRHFGETVRIGGPNHGKRSVWDELRKAVANTPGARPIDTT